MELKGIILYDKQNEVVGFVGLRTENGKTYIDVEHNFKDTDLVLSVNQYIFKLDTNKFTMDNQLDLSREVFATLVHRDGVDVVALASGIINQGKGRHPVTETSAKKEIDELLRSACNFSDDGMNACKSCPYREDFFKFQA